jgi:hypothetical protein
LKKCAFIKPGGERCGSIAMKGYDTCYGHREDLADERRRNASKGGKAGGRGRPSAELSQMKERLEKLAARVLGGTLDRADAAVVNQIMNSLLRCIETEKKLREESEILERIEALENKYATTTGRRQVR